MPYLALTGGVGGAKLALGLSRLLSPDALRIVANTADDFVHLGLNISPDLDTVMYTLADISNKDLGWGLAEESWQFMEAMERLGGETWFRLGDRDLATHIYRSHWLAEGKQLDEITEDLCRKLGVRHSLFPMTNDRVSTRVNLKDGGQLSFQHYFVRDRCLPEVSGFEFAEIERAKASRPFLEALEEVTGAIIICPSNPFVSVAPLLQLPGVVERIRQSDIPVVAVSPIVGGQAIKGPAAKMMAELGMPRTALAVAAHYADCYGVRHQGGLFTHFVMDQQDIAQEAAVRQLGFKTRVTQTIMQTLEDRVELARQVLAFVD